MKKAGRLLLILLLLAAAAAGLWFIKFRDPSQELKLPELPEAAGELLEKLPFDLPFLKEAAPVSQEEADVYANKVADITGSSTNGNVQNRYSGVVETQQTLDIPYDEQKTVSELFVEEGDLVEVGTPLFEFDTSDLEVSLDQAILDLDRLISQQESNQKQLETLQKEKEKAKQEQQLDYTIQIQSMEATIKENEYSQKTKQTEIDRTRASIENNQVTSELAGRVQKINETPGFDNNGNRLPYITIITEGDFRIKGTINETNIWSISEGMPVLIRSRIDENATWNGYISLVDMENQVQNNNGMYYGGGDSGNMSTKYPFYVELENSEGLMLGQHVFIELDLGQEEVKEGLWLGMDYISYEEDGTPFVWYANSQNHLEKRGVTLGEEDFEMYQVQILDGLTEEDFICYPDENCVEGAVAFKFDASTRY